MKQLVDERQQSELLDINVAVLVSRLFLFKTTMGETTVTLRRLLGDLPDPNVPDVPLRIPMDSFGVVQLDVKLDDHTFKKELVPAMDKDWAYRDPAVRKPDRQLVVAEAS